VAGCCECGNVPSGPIKVGNLLTEDLLASRELRCSMELVTFL
jgi:hypothetical protein